MEIVGYIENVLLNPKYIYRWGEEWSLGTFDAMLFGCVMMATTNSLYSALVTVAIWQVCILLPKQRRMVLSTNKNLTFTLQFLKCVRSWSGDKNQREKTNIEIFN